jgi:hypothetical protein
MQDTSFDIEFATSDGYIDVGVFANWHEDSIESYLKELAALFVKEWTL